LFIFDPPPRSLDQEDALVAGDLADLLISQFP